MRSLAKTVDARHYNRIRLALTRLKNPLRIELEQLGHVDVILSDQQWLCVDSSLDDQPILAWRDFSREDANSLHRPVKCTLHLYHAHGGVLMGQVLPALQQALERIIKSR